MTENWRNILGFRDDEMPSFAAVRTRYGRLMIGMFTPDDAREIACLVAALDAAEAELAPPAKVFE